MCTGQKLGHFIGTFFESPSIGKVPADPGESVKAAEQGPT